MYIYIYIYIIIYIYTIWIIVIHNICITDTSKKRLLVGSNYVWTSSASTSAYQLNPRVFNMELSKVGVRNHPSERLKPMVGISRLKTPPCGLIHIRLSEHRLLNKATTNNFHPQNMPGANCSRGAAFLPCQLVEKTYSWYWKTYRTKEAKQIGCCWTSVSIPLILT